MSTTIFEHNASKFQNTGAGRRYHAVQVAGAKDCSRYGFPFWQIKTWAYNDNIIKWHFFADIKTMPWITFIVDMTQWTCNTVHLNAAGLQVNQWMSSIFRSCDQIHPALVSLSVTLVGFMSHASVAPCLAPPPWRMRNVCDLCSYSSPFNRRHVCHAFPACVHGLSMGRSLTCLANIIIDGKSIADWASQQRQVAFSQISLISWLVSRLARLGLNKWSTWAFIFGASCLPALVWIASFVCQHFTNKTTIPILQKPRYLRLTGL